MSFIAPIDTESIGSTLVERAVDVHRVDGVEVVSRWYHSPSDCDLTLWLDSEAKLIRFQFNVVGQVVDWNAVSGFRTGLIVEIEYENGNNKTKQAETIRFDSELSVSAIRTAEAVLKASETTIHATWRELVLRLLASDVSVDRTSKSRGSPVSRRSRFWRRIRRWMLSVA